MGGIGSGRRRNTERERDIVERLAAGATLRELAVAYSITRQMVSAINQRATGRPLPTCRMEWPVERIEELRRLVRRGLSCAEIARRLSVSRSAVISKARRLGLSVRDRQRARTALRVTKAQALRDKGLEWTEVARLTGYSVSGVKHAVLSSQAPEPTV
jgi:DNA-binding CsgD family transcriptional regulator